ncbi:MAG: hypothetical protein KC503_43450 [Myxococcales bacterium]|nr:hypothetical protein [Myxococcales bacterium]
MTAKSKQSPTGLEGRKRDGTFARGHSLSPGRNRITMQQAKYRKVMHECVTEGDLRDVMLHVLSVAKGEHPIVDEHGNVNHMQSLAAAKLIFEYTMGKPRQMAEKADEGARLIVALARHHIQSQLAPHLAGPPPDVGDE